MKAKKKSFRTRELQSILQGTFPNYIVRLEAIPDDDYSMGVSVFNVPATLIRAVEDRIGDIDEKLRGDGPLALVPLVRDEATTVKFYPQFVGVSSAWDCGIAVADIDEYPLKMGFGSMSLDMSEHSGTPWELAANQELALAA